MFTKQNPCTARNDLKLFCDWWEMATNTSFADHDRKLVALRNEVNRGTEEVAIARTWRGSLSFAVRKTIGRTQEGLIPKRVQLLDLERAHPLVQPDMILAVPGVAGFKLRGSAIEVRTNCLYGRDFRLAESPWCRLGHFDFTLSVMKHGVVRQVHIHWSNRDGGRTVLDQTKPVPAPQVDYGGTRGCMGDDARLRMNQGLAYGRIDSYISTLIRYTEQPHPNLANGYGMGSFPAVNDAEVPRYYLNTFPR